MARKKRDDYRKFKRPGYRTMQYRAITYDENGKRHRTWLDTDDPEVARQDLT